MSVSFVDFARTGAFGSLGLGASRDEVVSVLGEPDDADASTGGERILRYGDIEFHFANRILQIVFVERLDAISGGRVALDGWSLSSSSTLSEVSDFLTRLEIETELSDYAPEPHSSQLRTVGGVVLVFTGASADVPTAGRRLATLSLSKP
jgi:hypothetical protein